MMKKTKQILLFFQLLQHDFKTFCRFLWTHPLWQYDG